MGNTASPVSSLDVVGGQGDEGETAGGGADTVEPGPAVQHLPHPHLPTLLRH
jgi:hypothetical protein